MRAKRKITVRIKGGLGNQLFIYAAARRLALVNDAPLELDHVSGFRNDPFGRQYSLHRFSIEQNLAGGDAFFATAGRFPRALACLLCRGLPFQARPYLVEAVGGFDPRFLDLRLERPVYLEGYWQSEDYFKDAADQIRKDLQIPALDADTMALARRMAGVESVSLHVRRLHGLPGMRPRVLGPGYYREAVALALERLRNPRFFVFSDSHQEAPEIGAIEAPVTFVPVGRGESGSYLDLWLMSRCQHHVIANSTFSWWGAWLNSDAGSLVVAPRNAPHFSRPRLVPERWVTLAPDLRDWNYRDNPSLRHEFHSRPPDLVRPGTAPNLSAE
jgi:Glycosyl transferase family 11